MPGRYHGSINGRTYLFMDDYLGSSGSWEFMMPETIMHMNSMGSPAKARGSPSVRIFTCVGFRM